MCIQQQFFTLLDKDVLPTKFKRDLPYLSVMIHFTALLKVHDTCSKTHLEF